MIGLLFHSPPGSLFQGDVHPAELLQKKLTGSGSTLVAGQDIGDSSGSIKNIGHEGFTPGGNNSRAGGIVRPRELIGKLHGLGFGDGRELHDVAKFSACGGDPVKGSQVKAVQGLDERLLRISVVWMHGVTDQAGSVSGCRPAGF